MEKKGVGLIIISTLIFVVSLTTTVFAWFSLVEKTQPIIIYSGSVELEVHLYDSDNNEINDINYTKVVPGDVYNFKLTVKNLGSIRSDLDVKFNLLASNNLKNYITFNISDTETPAFSDSTTFTSASYTYENILTYQQEVTINFSVTISGDIELTDLSLNDLIEITSIEITLEQII